MIAWLGTAVPVAVGLTLLAAGVLTSCVLAAAAPRLVRDAPPGPAAVILTAGAAVCAVCTSGALLLVAALGLAHLPTTAHWGDLSRSWLATRDPVPVWVGVIATLAFGALAVRTARPAARTCRALWEAERFARDVHRDHAPELIVLPEATPVAYALGGVTGGRVALSRGLLDLLGDDERAAVLAHEQAHLRGRHHLLRVVVELAARVNPLLRRLPRLVELATERSADEQAAAAVGSRRTVAVALSRTALAARPAGATRPQATASAFFGDGNAVVTRVEAMLEPRRARRWPIVGVAALLAATLAATLVGARSTDAVLDHAHVRACVAISCPTGR